MKNRIFNTGFYPLLVSLTLCFNAKSQSNILNISQKNPFSLTVCMEADTFELIIKNNSTTFTASNLNIEIGFPSTGIYWAGYAAASSGSMSVTDTLSSNPKFNLPSLLPQQSISLRYTARAACNVLADVSSVTMINSANITYDVAGQGTFAQVLTNGTSYNLLYASLSITSRSTNQIELDNASITDRFYRTNPTHRIIEIINTSSGAIDEIVIRITPEPEIVYNAFTDESEIYSFPFVYDSNGDVLLTLSAPDLYVLGAITGDDPNKFEQFEVAFLYEDFTVVSCSQGNILNEYKAEWGCNGQTCTFGNNHRASSNVSASGGKPSLKQTIGNPVAVTNYCKEDGILTFNYTNTATGLSNFATDMVLDVISTSNYTPRGFTLYDFTLNGILLDPLMVTAKTDIQWIGFASDAGHVTPGYRIDLSSNTNAALAMDLDGDGFYDDLGAGKTFTLTAKIRFDDPQPFEAQCPINYYAMFGLPQSHYKAACSDSLLESLDYGTGQFYTASLFPNSLANLITAPTDMIEDQPEQFTFCTGSWSNPLSMDFFDCPLDSHYVTINIPDGYYPVNNDVLFSSIAGDSHPLTSTFDGSILSISGGAQSFIAGQERTWNGCYTLSLAMSCNSADNGVIANQSTISWTLNYLCDTCNIIQTKVCSSYTIFNHADCSEGNLSCDGIVTTGFDVNRTTFGWTDYSLTTRVQATDPDINLDAAYVYDTIQTITDGRVKGNNFSQLYAEIRYEASDALMKWTSGVVKVFDVSGNLVSTCAIVNPPDIVVLGTLFTYKFTLPLTCMGAISPDYTLKLINDWEVLNSQTAKSYKVYDIPVFRSNFHYERNDTLFKCDEWGAKFSLYNYGSFPFVFANKINKCDPIKVVMFVKNYGGSDGDDFPNEIRHLFRLDNRMVAYIPDGYTYIADSAYTYQVIDASDPLNPVTVLIPVTPVFQDADSVVFEYNWPVLDKYEQSGSVNIYPPLIQFQLKPTCERQNVTSGYLNYGYTNYDYSSVTAYHTHTQAVLALQEYKLTNPVPRLSVNTGAYIVDGYTNKVKWQIQICNQVGGGQSQVGEAQNLWIDVDNALTNSGNIQIDRVYVSASNTQTVINYPEGDDINSLLQLGNLAANTCRTYTLEGSYVNCAEVTDTLKIRTGWSCDGYPVPEQADAATCYISENILAVRYKTAALNMVVTAPATIIEVCDTLSYLIELQSVGVAMMYEVDFWANVPNGASIINPEYLYTLGSGTWKALPSMTNSFSGSNPSGWHLSQILSEWSTYNGGFYGSQRPDSSKIQLRFDVALNCEYNPNDSIVFNAFGYTNCQTPFAVSPNVKRILIDGFTALDDLEISITLPDTLQCNETGRIDVTVSNPSSSANQYEDSLKIEIPAIFSVLMAQPFGAIIQNNGTETDVKWKIPPMSIAAGASSVYSIFVVGNTVSECTAAEIPGTVYYVGSSSCGQTVCNPTAIIDEDNKPVQLCCSPCTLTAAFEADTVCIGDTSCFLLNNQASMGSDFVHTWDFGDGFTSDLEQPCHIYNIADTFTVIHTVMQLSNGCSAEETKQVIVNEYAQGSIELLGCNPFCEGDTVYLTVTGSYERIEWVELSNPGVVIGTMDTLTVSTGGVYNAIVYNGKCAGDCLAISLSQQEAPEISIPDTAFCVGDSILLCAGGGFTSYEWQLNGTVFNSVDSCIYISSLGQYIVTVGEKLPFGCCTCEGVDTFNVIINTISAQVPDLTLCEGQNSTLCVNPSGGYAPYSFVWQPNGKITSCIAVNTSVEYIVTVTDAMGCTAVDTGVVTIDSPPNAEFNYNDTVCINAESCFVPINSGTHSWQVTDSTGAVITTSSANPFCYLFPYIGTFSVTHILTNECGTDTVIRQIVVVEPVKACIVLTGSNPFCVGDTVCLSVDDPFNRVVQVEWYLNDVLVFVGDEYCVTEPGTYRAVVTDLYGCVSECMCIVLTQNPLPVLNLPSFASLCADGTYTLDAEAGFAEYHWYRNGLPYSFGTSSITVTSGGTYIIEVSDSNACTARDTTIISGLSSIFYISSTDIMVCQGESFVLSTNCNPNYTYRWFKKPTTGKLSWNEIVNSGNCKINLSYTDMYVQMNTTFKVEITNPTTGCIYEATITINRDNCLEILIFPNPITGDQATINYDLLGQGYTNAIIEFRSLTGETVAVFPADTGLQEVILDVAGLASGSYRVSLIADGQTIDEKQVSIVR